MPLIERLSNSNTGQGWAIRDDSPLLERRVRRRWTRLGAEAKQRLADEYRGGSEVAALVARFGIDRSTVRRYLDELGNDRRPRVSAEVVARGIELYREGLSTQAAAQQAGLHPITPGRTLRERGIETR